MNIYFQILTAFAVSFLIRVLPLTLLRKQIKSRFVRSFLHYVPFVTLSVMTFPAILHATDSFLAGLIALLCGVALSFAGAPMFLVAFFCCVLTFAVGFFF